MHVRIRRIIKLVRPDRPLRRARKVPRLVIIVPRVLIRYGRHGAHVRTEHQQQVYLLLALRVWHVDHAAVALGAADVR